MPIDLFYGFDKGFAHAEIKEDEIPLVTSAQLLLVVQTDVPESNGFFSIMLAPPAKLLNFLI